MIHTLVIFFRNKTLSMYFYFIESVILREFPTPVILDVARRGGAARTGKKVSQTRATLSVTRQIWGLGPNRGHGSMEQSELNRLKSVVFRLAMVG